jgi:dCTP deaminase
MIFSDRDIKHGQLNGHGYNGFTIVPFDSEQIQPASYDVRLANVFRIFERGHNTFIDPLRKQEGLTRRVAITEGERFILHPDEFVLGMTVETIKLSSVIAARIEGKSSLGRVGLVIHSTAGWIDPGFEGTITLEISNASPLPLVLTPGMSVAQIAFMWMFRRAEKPYGHPDRRSKYQGHIEPTESRYHEEA